MQGEFISFGAEEDEKLAVIEQDNWPHAFAKCDCGMRTFIRARSCNHIHGTYRNWVKELQVFCEATNIDFVNFLSR